MELDEQTVDTTEFPNVQQYENILLVGEKHRNKQSGELVKRICNQENPAAVAVEHGPYYNLSWWMLTTKFGGLYFLEAYAKYNDIPLFNIDVQDDMFRKAIRKELSEDIDYTEAVEIANEFTKPVTEDGKVHEQCILDARERVKQQLGKTVYNIIYDFREEHMAKQLTWINEEFEETVVVGVGAFHTLSVYKKLKHCKDAIPPHGYS